MAQPLLDHLVILVPHETLHSPPSWLTSAFHIFPGGQHADGRTANNLILFSDGTYIELIAFLPHVAPEDRLTHRWGREKEGHIIDYALSLAVSDPAHGAEELFEPIRKRVEDGSRELRYTAPARGGRTQKNGTEIKWAISSAQRREGEERDTIVAELPFWCLDRTSRPLRVPYQEPKNVTHSSGAKGVAALDVIVSSSAELDVYRLIADVDSRAGDDGARVWALAVPEGPASELRVRVRDQDEVVQDTGKIRLAISTGRGGKAGRIGGELAGGVELCFELRPEQD